MLAYLFGLTEQIGESYRKYLNKMDIRKISVGPDYKSGAMHYLVGQDILNGNFHIHLIRKEESSICIYIQQKDEILLLSLIHISEPTRPY